MKRILLLLLGYFLLIQAILGAFIGFSSPEYLLVIWIVCGFAGWLGYLLIKKGRGLKPQPEQSQAAGK